MAKCIIRGLKRCPSCGSSNIYRRVRTIQIRRDRKRRKANKTFIEDRVKQYRCHNCKHEFDEPIVK